jgi:hypothetical protein
MAESGDLRLFIREMLQRNERAFEAMIGRLDEQRLALADMRVEIADSRRQIQANTQAVLSLLDRLS